METLCVFARGIILPLRNASPEIAELIGFKKRTIVRWLQTEKKCEESKLEKQWRVRHKDFAEFLEQQSHRKGG